ncbi:universal stress protein [Thermochromatium tepidum]|uniref:Universal stress protein n=1 Tax=Thermochromatium tepidum ATCC 43061 TaxID=316276 RepID=A0A6I6DW63_THETI|nr:universal stress protein [Thermochromatium tepidum]QGU31711.1 universal stress protein [Thermochromatium tepidum ATCC 43061]
MKTILLAYDGSQPAIKAYDWAADLAAKYGATLRVLMVARPPEFGDDVETEAVIESSRKHCRKVLDALREKTQAAGLAAQFEVTVGHPSEQIILRAEEWGADLIVMGHRGTGLLSRWLIGSAARQVIAYAPCAVMVVR